MSTKTVVLCGGSNGSHVLIADLARRGGWEVRLLSSRPEAWGGPVRCTEYGGLSEDFPFLLGRRPVSYAGAPSAVFGWDEAPRALEGADAVLLVCPVHAHRSVLERVLPALDMTRPVMVGSLYAQGGLDWIIRDLLREHGLSTPKVAFFGLKRYPYLCKHSEYGAAVTLYGRFPRTVATIEAPNPELRAMVIDTLGAIFDRPVSLVPSFLSCTLNMSNQLLHPGLGWGHFHDYVPGETTYPDKIRFYGDCNARGAHAMELLYRDLFTLLRELERFCGLPLAEFLSPNPSSWLFVQARARLDLDLESWPWWGAMQAPVMAAILRSNRRLNQVFAPMIPSPEGGFVPDFSSRFWLDDIGHGLCVLYGLGQILGLEMANVRTMIHRHQAFMGKRMLDGDDFGPDLDHTNAPQRYGVRDVTGLESLLGW